MQLTLHCHAPEGKIPYVAILANRRSCPVFFAETKEKLIEKAISWCGGEETQSHYVNKRVLQTDYDPYAVPDFYLKIDIEDFSPPVTMPSHTPCWLLDSDYKNMKSLEDDLAAGTTWEGPTGTYHSGPSKEGLEKRRLEWLESIKKK